MPVVIGMRLTRWPLRLGALKQLATHVLQAVGEAEALLSLEIVGDVRMRRLNRTFRHRDKTTDVLAFATREGPGHPRLFSGTSLFPCRRPFVRRVVMNRALTTS